MFVWFQTRWQTFISKFFFIFAWQFHTVLETFCKQVFLTVEHSSSNGVYLPPPHPLNNPGKRVVTPSTVTTLCFAPLAIFDQILIIFPTFFHFPMAANDFMFHIIL
jgi:hypothetical protein